jgi:hypothetical protein
MKRNQVWRVSLDKIKNPSQAVICLHDIARYIEKQYGNGALSLDLRRVADRLNEVAKKQ